MPRPFLNTITRTLFFYFVVGIMSCILLPFALLYALLPEKIRFSNTFYYRVSYFFYSFVVWAMMIPVTWKGSLPIKGGPFIIIANHQSALDVAFVGAALGGRPHVWLLLDSVAKKPIVGFLFRRVGIVVDQSSARASLASIIQALKILRSYPTDLVLFPEGGRFTDGTIHDFFSGFAMLSCKTGQPVVPIHIKNIQTVYPPRSFLLNYNSLTVTVSEPLAKHPDESEEAFAQRVHGWFQAQAAS